LLITFPLSFLIPLTIVLPFRLLPIMIVHHMCVYYLCWNENYKDIPMMEKNTHHGSIHTSETFMYASCLLTSSKDLHLMPITWIYFFPFAAPFLFAYLDDMYIFVMLSQFSLHIHRYTIYFFSAKYYTWTLWIAPCCHHWCFCFWWWCCCCCFYCIER